jgi:CheY-like chemotaxis protein
MKSRLNLLSVAVCIFTLTLYSLYITYIHAAPGSYKSIFIAIGVLSISGAVGLCRLNQQLVFAKNRIKSWRSYSKKTSRSAHKFIIDRIVDLRRPLQGLVGIHELYTAAGSKQEGLDFLNIADFCSRYLIRQLERIQFYSEIELGTLKFEPTVFSLQKCVQDAVVLASDQARTNHVTIVEEYGPTIPEFVYGSEVAIRKLLLELIDNSVRHAGNTKTTIRILPDPNNKDQICFVVNDNGPGVSKDKMDEIMAVLPDEKKSIPWRNAREGLGMIIVKKILQRLGGSLTANSQTGLGATISFTLPADKLTPAHRPDNIMNLNADELRVLIVDDEEVTRQILSALFRRLNVRVDMAVNGHDAIAKVHLKPYDLVVMDLSMPVVDGFMASEAILNSTKIKTKPKILVASSHCRQEDRDRCAQIGVSAFLPKPMRLEALKLTLIELGFIKESVQENLPNNVVSLPIRAERARPRIKETGYYINFNSLYNSLNENLTLCRELLNRTSKDISAAIESLALTLKNKELKSASNILHRIHGELSMVHCVHGLDLIQKMQSAIATASEEDLQGHFQDVSDYLDSLCEEIERLTRDEDDSIAA